MERFFHRFQDGRGGQGYEFRRGPRRNAEAQGSGFFISADGYVVTNNHVVDHASEVQVTMDDGRTLDAKIVGTDPKTDLAVLRVKEGGNFPYVPFAAKAPRVGDWVVAIGNPFGLGGTVTAGIVSARGRDIGAGPYDDFLQIDAPVNRGNSGGPIFNLNGEVVGINTAIASPSGGNIGIAFAIPSDAAQKVVASLKDNGSVSRGFIGVQIQPITKDIAEAMGLKEPKGALVAETVQGGPAEKAGLKRGDTIVAVDGQTISEPKELSRRIAAIEPGKSGSLTVLRDGQERTVTIEIGRQNDHA
jgi:serine protease Do